MNEKSLRETLRHLGCCLIAVFFLSTLSPAILWAEIVLDPRGESTLNYWSRYGKVRLEMERIRFTLGEDIPVRIRMENRGYQVIRIYPSTLPNKSFQFFLTDRQGREMNHELDLFAYNKRKGKTKVVNLQGREVKEIILAPGESFEKVFYLNDLYRLKAGQEYRAWLYFYPRQDSEFFVRSENTVLFRITPKSKGQPERARITPAEEKRFALSPEETVYLFLSAETQKRWPNYLKYLDLKKFISAYSNYASRYAQAQPEDRPGILKEFSGFLISDPVDQLKRFRLLGAEPEHIGPANTLSQERRHIVRALGIREGSGYRARYEYRYTLEPQRDDSFWKIIYVEAKLIR